jgi:hypothetical protein
MVVGQQTRGRPDDAQLLISLNALLSDLAIPFTLCSPTELTPSLLLAILESLLQARLPLPFSHTSNGDKAQAVKVFLGVLESDVLRNDVGVSAIDPRRLARGEAKETSLRGCYAGSEIRGRSVCGGKEKLVAATAAPRLRSHAVRTKHPDG